MNPLFARSFQDVVTLFAKDLTLSERRCAAATARRMTPVLDDLFASATFAPLHQMAQQGFAPLAFHRDVRREPIPFRQTPRGYTRANHAKYVAAANAVAAASLHLSERDTDALVLAGALHDVGHLHGGHSMEYAYREVCPAFDHETNGIETIRGSALRPTFERIGVRTQDVINIIDEQGPLGAIQRVTDTLAYAFVDTLAYGFMGHQDDARPLPTVRAFFDKLSGVHAGSVLQVTDLAPLQEILTWRAMLYRDQFCGIVHGRTGDALKTVIRRLDALGIRIDPRRFVSDEDALAQLSAGADTLGRETAGVLKAMLDMRNQTGAPTGWHSHEFVSEAAMKDFLAYGCDADAVTRRSFRYVRRPEGLLIKTVPVVCGGERLMVGPRQEELLPIEGPAAVLYEWTG